MDSTQPPIQWVKRFSPQIKQSECEAGISPHLIPKLKFVEIYIYSPICFHGVQNGKVTVIVLSIRTAVVCVPYWLVWRVVTKSIEGTSCMEYVEPKCW
jgi:hypothetical protein